MTRQLTREEIIELLSDKSNRKKIIDFVFDTAQKTLYEIADNNPDVWVICASGSYTDPDPEGRWPRIVLPKYPHVFVPPIYTNKRGIIVYGASDFDVDVFTDNTYDSGTDFLRPFEKRDNVRESLKKFREKTGVIMSLKVIFGLFELGKERAYEITFGKEKYIPIYER